MASFSALNVSSSATTQNLMIINLPCSISLRSNVSFNISKKNPRLFVGVKAMGGVMKFKGTQMREKKLTEMIEKKVLEAKEVCSGENDDEISDECKVAWDEVEEISQAKADFRKKIEKEDPLEYFCNENPETDECRVYED